MYDKPCCVVCSFTLVHLRAVSYLHYMYVHITLPQHDTVGFYLLQYLYIYTLCALPYLQYSSTSCHRAALNGHLEMTRLLINYGASCRRKDMVCYYDTLTIKLHVWNVNIKKCMYKLLFAQHEIYRVESISNTCTCTMNSQYSKLQNVTNILIIYTKFGVICFSDNLYVYTEYLHLHVVLYIHAEYSVVSLVVFPFV